MNFFYFPFSTELHILEIRDPNVLCDNDPAFLQNVGL